MNFILDTGALLSLPQSVYFEELIKQKKLFTTKEVMEEIHNIAQYDDILGIAAKKIIKKKQLLEIGFPKKLLQIKIEPAELSVFSLGKEKGYFIITDDMHAARIAKEKENIKSAPSFYLLLLLYKQKKISKENLKEDIQKIVYNRNWSSGVLYEYAKEIIRGL